ncbi:MAG TPA: hypothetical protein VN844_11510 [Pyrinomonadaceae bacterium]|nr:hypothetical protein [Pyrinomonadaceae bacterium]
MRTLITLLITVITFASVGVAQSKKDKFEIGVQSTSLTVFPPDVPFDETRSGIGGRIAYNFNRSIAAEAEINFFPQKQLIFTSNGNSIQAHFGVKLGKRFEKFGVFGKVRPGFINAGGVFSFIPGSQVAASNFKRERESFFTTDFGGVLELYPSSRMVVRFDAGDTIIRNPAQFALIDFSLPAILIRPPKFTHNFQFTAGVAFRLGDFPDREPAANTSGGTENRTKRFEVGAQFTSLFVKPSNSRGALTDPRIHTEPGFGGRVTFNLTESIAFEAEGNYFTREQFSFPESGQLFQGQFGGKIGRRFDKWGVFGKARPGFVGFSRVIENPLGINLPPFSIVRKLYPSIDLGGVVEFYMSPRVMARFDVGDTIIRYGELHFPALTVPTVTRHNLQLSSGIGFRFK